MYTALDTFRVTGFRNIHVLQHEDFGNDKRINQKRVAICCHVSCQLKVLRKLFHVDIRHDSSFLRGKQA